MPASHLQALLHGMWMGAIACQRLLFSARRQKLRQLEQLLQRHYELLGLRRHQAAWSLGWLFGWLVGLCVPMARLKRAYIWAVQRLGYRLAPDATHRIICAKICQETQDIP